MSLKHLCITAAAVVALGLPLAAQQQSLRAGNPTAAMESLQGFNIVLLVGETHSSGLSLELEDVPASARKALADMKDFLPFKMYRVLDSQWISCCGRTPTATVAGRLQGVMTSGGADAPVRLLPRSFNYTLHASPASGQLSIRFSMGVEGTSRASSGDRITAEEVNLRVHLAEAERERDALQRRRQDNLANWGPNHPDMVKLQADIVRAEKRLAALANDLAAQRADEGIRGKAIIDSSFTMDAGETVVVGTSRLGGDKALIALVTAARKGGSTR